MPKLTVKKPYEASWLQFNQGFPANQIAKNCKSY